MEIENSRIKAGREFRKVIYIKNKKHLAKILIKSVQSWRKISKQDQKYANTSRDR